MEQVDSRTTPSSSEGTGTYVHEFMVGMTCNGCSNAIQKLL